MVYVGNEKSHREVGGARLTDGCRGGFHEGVEGRQALLLIDEDVQLLSAALRPHIGLVESRRAGLANANRNSYIYL